jgi:hypothetical protein
MHETGGQDALQGITSSIADGCRGNIRTGLAEEKRMVWR